MSPKPTHSHQSNRGSARRIFRRKSQSLYVRRFDRTPEGGKIHIEDFNQIYHQFPHDKYKHYSYTNMARDISNFLGADAVSEFIRRLVFNAAIGNADMTEELVRHLM